LNQNWGGPLLEQKEVFFFEKKKQKTFTKLASLYRKGRGQIDKVFCNCPGVEMASTEGKRQSKRFFFEKKNQKTFTNSG
jgi:hypothetical protein